MVASQRTVLRRSYIEISKICRLQYATNQAFSARSLHCHKRSFTTTFAAKNYEDRSRVLKAIEVYKSSFTTPATLNSWESLKKENIGHEITLFGYLGSRDDISKKLSFVPLYNASHSKWLQIVSYRQAGAEDRHDKLRNVKRHTPIVVKGLLKERLNPRKDVIADDMVLDVELSVLEVWPLNEAPDDITVLENMNYPPEQRYLQIKMNFDVRKALVFRSSVAMTCRKTLDRWGFTEVETPILFKSTPEGAREFIVPTRTRGLAYALAQSPQQYKQILMASGIHKYYQFARCFRDEDSRADRQPEFTQLDLEMSFQGGNEVMKYTEELLRKIWEASISSTTLDPDPFPRVTYDEAMSRYGSDKPDTRLGMEITRMEHLLPADLISKISPIIQPIVEGIKLSVSETPRDAKKFIKQFMDSPEAALFNENVDGQPGFFIYDCSKPLQGLQALGFEAAEQAEEIFGLQDGNVLVLQARENKPLTGGSTMLGNLRLALHRAAVSQELIAKPKGFAFLWVTDFPLFSPANGEDPGQGGSAGICSTHHPFTAPKTVEDIDMLLEDPTKVTGEHYDIVVNGVELGGGSKRIHVAAMQELIFRDILKMSEERIEDFRHLLNALKSGCPPHAGIALGFDRLIAVLLGHESVRDVIAFPKSGKGEDMLVKSPQPLTEEQLATYHLRLRNA